MDSNSMSVYSKSTALPQPRLITHSTDSSESLPRRTQAGTLSLFLLVLYLVPVLVLISVILVHDRTGVSLLKFMRDPADLMGANPFTGFVSNLGVLFWCAAAAVCLFSWPVLRNRFSTAPLAAFVLYAGLLTTVLLLDDLFQLHEAVLPHYFHVPEVVTYACYAVASVAMLVTFRDRILKTDYLVLLMSLVFLGLSMLSDAFQPRMEQLLGEWRILSEDGFKFFGIVGWFGYFSRSCFIAIKDGFAE